MENNEKMIDKIIQNSYNDIQVPHNMFEDIYDNIEENTKQSKLMYISIAAAILVIVLIAIFAIFNTKQNVNDDESTTILNGNNEETQAELPIASETINTLGDSYQQLMWPFVTPVGNTLIETNTPYIAIVKVNKIIGYTNYIKKLDKYNQTPFIISDVSVEKVFKGELPDNIEMMSYGGVISISDYEKANEEYQEVGNTHYDYLTQEEKDNTYIRILNTFTLNTLEPDEGKYYLVFMNYSDNLENYHVMDTLIYEYDITTNCIRNTDTNKWEPYEYNSK